MAEEVLDGVIAHDVDPADVEVGRRIGQGVFASVYLAKLNGSVVAVKKQRHPEPGGHEDVDLVLRHIQLEVEVLGLCAHPNIIPYVGTWSDSDETWIVTTFASCGDLLGLLEDKAIERIGEPLETRLAYQVCDALSYLHDSLSWMHRDLKSANVLLSRGHHVQLADFGLATRLDANGRAHTICGTEEYMAPELHVATCHEEPSYERSADVFSLGVVLLEILSRKRAADLLERDARSHFHVDAQAVREACSGDHHSQRLLQLAMLCIENDPKERPTSMEALEDLGRMLSTPTEKVSDVVGHVRHASYDRQRYSDAESSQQENAYSPAIFLGHLTILSKTISPAKKKHHRRSVSSPSALSPLKAEMTTPSPRKSLTFKSPIMIPSFDPGF